MHAPNDIDVIDGIRAFNRFYTDRIGLLDRAYLKADYTLAEARVLYEIGARGTTTATDLVRDIHLDPAYLSRILKVFRDRGLVAIESDPADRRSRRLRLTPVGTAEYEQLADLSRGQIREMLSALPASEQEGLASAMQRITGLLGSQETQKTPMVLRPHRPGDLGWIIQSQTEFYASEFGWRQGFEGLVAKVAADFLAGHDPRNEACWIAERSGVRLGSIMVVNGGGDVAKLRLLYVDPMARGLGLGMLLAEQATSFARQSGYRRMTLWTNDNLDAARHIYRKLGFSLVSEEKHTLFGPELTGQTWEIDL
ncbi:MarR family transcriptional regulator [Ciceribacter sp. L1K23]|uniref:bifunctional helix-turn-helix transcriptional regulator/GNAT family N-acetyltransferase n=1 Tax=Ciceribacter sp. L1K23 TaxID=2820276 RepID=UPI001B81AAB5|nr:helix-turn-helix domain-containing GNAT family N-acetyltransferase [Ciceribacter sp. L1K23]MBR0555182.1 MarR family transcriptional regulator [Ciceribacter sp. L1K23]